MGMKKSSQTVHDQIFNDLYNNVLNGKSAARAAEPVEYESEEEEESEEEVEAKGKGWTPAKHYSNGGSKSSSGKVENRGAHLKKGAKPSSGPKGYQKIPKSQQKPRGRKKKDGSSAVSKKSEWNVPENSSSFAEKTRPAEFEGKCRERNRGRR